MSIPIKDLQIQDYVPKPLRFLQVEMEAADEQITQLLQKHAIIECDSISEGDFFSTVFLRPKKDGGYQMILNLKDFNQFVEYLHFKMETLKDICNAMIPGCFMAVTDLKDAYLVISILGEHCCFLKFHWCDKIYYYLVLPFGLTCAPQIFTNLLKVPLSEIRVQGHIVCMYIDDAFLKWENVQERLQATQCFFDTFVPLGFLPHPDKYRLTPSQVVEVLGFIINSVSMTVSISLSKA